MELIFSGLLKVDEHLDVAPDLAESFESPDPTTYIFHLRPNVKFHDGTALRAEDVIYTFRYMADEANASPFRTYFKLISDVTISDPRTIRVKLQEPNAFFPIAARRPIVSERIATAAGREGFSKVPVGAGPFRLVENRERSGILLQAFHEYYAGAPPTKKIQLKPILDLNIRILELKKGSVDLLQNSVDGFPAGSLDQLRKDPNIQVDHRPGNNVQYLNFNLHHPVLKNPLVRRAIAMAIDRNSIIKFKFGGLATAATGYLPPHHWAYTADVPTYSFDPSRAKKLLRQAGVRKLSLTYRTSTNPQSIEIAQVIAGYLSDIGIDVTVRSTEFGVLFDDIKKGNFDLYSLQWTSILSPDELFDVFDSKQIPPNGLNRNFYSNPKVDELLERGRTISSRSEQLEIYRQVQKILAEDLPAFFLWYPEQIAAYRKRVEGYQIHPRGTYESLSHVVLTSP